MSLINLLGFALIILWFWLTILWAFAEKTKKASVIDIHWSLMIAVSALIYFIFNEIHFHRLIIAGMVFSWALRLSIHILIRSHGKGEDPRYSSLKEKWGENKAAKMYIFYLLQGIAAFFFSLPFFIAAVNPIHANWEFLSAIGFLVWSIGFSGEWTADKQLARFKADPANRGKTCQTGLWRYSRHPNYFFEWLIWCGFALFVSAFNWGWLSLTCPLIMYVVLVHLTGIPKTEEHALNSRGEEYRQYQSRTPKFFPRLPLS